MTTARETIIAILGGAITHESGLNTLAVAPADEVSSDLVARLDEACVALWRRGWQPVELVRVVTRRGLASHEHMVSDAVAMHLARFPRSSVDERWLAQAEAIDANLWWRSPASYVDEVAARWKSDRVVVIDTMVALLVILTRLPPIEVLIAPPGTSPDRASNNRASSESGPAGRVNVRLLDRVRALLAKAEATDYPAEAEAYTAKAQELAVRHSLDEALLVARDGGTPVVPFARRIGVDHPYESEKASLLDAVARVNRCHTVWSPDLAFTTVFGFDSDIDAVDLLYTSLLVQAHRAMAQSEPPGGKAGRARLKAFRRSFLVAFAVRIGERLAAVAEAALADVTRTAVTRAGDPVDSDLLPVLAQRDEQVRETMRRVFPETIRARGSRVDSREGWVSGRAAADRAALEPGALGSPR